MSTLTSTLMCYILSADEETYEVQLIGAEETIFPVVFSLHSTNPFQKRFVKPGRVCEWTPFLGREGGLKFYGKRRSREFLKAVGRSLLSQNVHDAHA